MYIERLEIQQFRNLQYLRFSPHSQFNVLYGRNGSGKTSILEAIYYLAFGKSFRTHLASRVIQYGKDNLAIFAQTSENSIGLERKKNGEIRLRKDMQDVEAISEILKSLPLQIVHADTHQLIDAGPKGRRQFIDWGLFHVEPEFLTVWRSYQRILKQRNAALRNHLSSQQIQLWDKSLLENATIIDDMRKKYIAAFVPLFLNTLNDLLNIENIGLTYYPGWSEETPLERLLQEQLARDMQLATTQAGPHRADLKITVNKIPAEAVLSRGQQKLFIYAMRLAQGILLKEQAQRTCIYLLDDLPAELDHEKREQVCRVLADLKAQIFITTVDKAALEMLEIKGIYKTFHVEHGNIQEDT